MQVMGVTKLMMCVMLVDDFSNTVPLCSCPMSVCLSVCVLLYVSLCLFTFFHVCCLNVSASSFTCSLYFCFCAPVFGSLSSPFFFFWFHPCVFIRWTLQQPSLERGGCASVESPSVTQRAVSGRRNYGYPASSWPQSSG